MDRARPRRIYSTLTAISCGAYLTRQLTTQYPSDTNANHMVNTKKPKTSPIPADRPIRFALFMDENMKKALDHEAQLESKEHSIKADVGRVIRKAITEYLAARGKGTTRACASRDR
jgi:hypothetical protein